MNNFINKLFNRSKNHNYINSILKNIREETQIDKILDAIESFSKSSEIRFVGGCIRKILNNEQVEDIDLAVNLKPSEVCDALKKKI